MTTARRMPAPAPTLVTASPAFGRPVVGLRVAMPKLVAQLTNAATGAPIAEQQLVFSAGSSVVGLGVTDESGVAQCGGFAALQAVASLGYTVTFEGNAAWAPTTAIGRLAVLAV